MDDKVLVKIIIIYSIMSILFLYGAISFFRGVNPFNNRKIVSNNTIMKVFQTRILPIVFVLSALWFSGRPILDYIIKDYKTTRGILRDINAPVRNIAAEELKIVGENDAYYLPKGFLSTEKKGTEYEFSYGKRSRVIIEIHEVK